MITKVKMPMTLRKRKRLMEIYLDDDFPPKKKTTASKPKNKNVSSGRKLETSASKTKEVSRSAHSYSLRRTNEVELVGRKRRKTGVTYSLAEIQNRPIGSVRSEDPRNGMFNFTPKSTRGSSRLTGENARTKSNLSRNQNLTNNTIGHPNRRVSLRLAAPKRVNRDVTPPNSAAVRNRGARRGARALRRGRSGRNPASSMIYHLPDEDRYISVADGVTLMYSPSPDGRLSIGLISMQPKSSFEKTEMRTRTTVYTVLKGRPTFSIRNLGVNDKGSLGSAFTNLPGSTLKVKNGNRKALISFATFHWNNP